MTCARKRIYPGIMRFCFCIRYGGLILQIPQQEQRHHYVKCTVCVRDYLDGTLGIFYGHHSLARYDQEGNLLTLKEKQIQAA